jgi:hypothetical protein
LLGLEGFVDPPQVFPVCRVEVVLDAVVAAAWDFLRDVRPLVAHLLVKTKYHSFFLLRDRDFADRWI